MDDDLVLEYVDRIAIDEFGYPYAQLAATPSGKLFVSYLENCRWVAVDLPSRTVVRKFGRCGGGPQEFGQILGVATLGDTALLAYDLRRASLLKLTTDGRVVERGLAPELIKEVGATSLGNFSLIGESLLVASVVPNGSDDGSLIVTDLTGSIIDRFFPPLPRNLSQSATRKKPIRGCGAEWPNGTGSVVGVNPWHGEIVVLSLDGRSRWYADLQLDWLTPVKRRDGGFGVSRRTLAPICMPGGVVLRYARRDPAGYPRNPFRTGYVELRDTSGARRLAFSVDTSAAYLFEGIGTTWRDYLIFADRHGEVPGVLLFRLRPRTSSDTSAFIPPPAESELR